MRISGVTKTISFDASDINSFQFRRFLFGEKHFVLKRSKSDFLARFFESNSCVPDIDDCVVYTRILFALPYCHSEITRSSTKVEYSVFTVYFDSAFLTNHG